jgi:hypothetical protein
MEVDRRTGWIRERIFQILDAAGEGAEFSKILGLSLAETLHERIGGADLVSFDNMFRELHYLILSEELTSEALDLAMEIYSSADDLDRRDYQNRRRVEIGA